MVGGQARCGERLLPPPQLLVEPLGAGGREVEVLVAVEGDVVAASVEGLQLGRRHEVRRLDHRGVHVERPPEAALLEAGDP